MPKRYNFKDNFEMLYLRHEYISKAGKLDGRFVKEYAPIVNSTSRIMYERLFPNFNKVGFYEEDIVAISNIYMLSYMNLYSIVHNPDAYDKFMLKHNKSISKKELARKDRNNLINFLRQRLYHCSTLCSRKARNITVGRDIRKAFAATKNAVRASTEELLSNHKKLGYRSITKKELVDAKIIAKENGEQSVFDKNGFPITEIEIYNNGISHEDYSLLIKLNDTLFMKTPEAATILKENEKELVQYKNKFNGLSLSSKKRCLTKFIEKNRNKKYLKKELSLARKMIKDPKTWDNYIMTEQKDLESALIKNPKNMV